MTASGCEQPLLVCPATVEQECSDPDRAVSDEAAGLASLPAGPDHAPVGGEMVWAYIASKPVCVAEVLKGLIAAAFGERMVAGLHFVVVGHSAPSFRDGCLVTGVMHSPLGTHGAAHALLRTVRDAV